MLSVQTTGANPKIMSISLEWADTNQVSPRASAIHTGQVGGAVLRELHITGTQLLVGCASFLGAISLALWAVVKLWLFEA